MASSPFKSIFFSLFSTFLGFINCNAQVGMGTLTPQGALDITSTTDGLLMPRIALSATNVATVTTPTTSELVYNTFTSAAGATQVTPGFYYWDGAAWIAVATGANSDWKLTGNAGTVAGTNFVGTTDAIDYVTKTNNTERVRVLSNGRVGINNAAPAASDMLTVTSSGTSAYAINGYSANNGSAVYGSISSGTTTFGAVQGEYFGTASTGTAIRGITFCATAGTTLTDANSAVNGQLGAANGNSVFSFAIKGQALNNAGNQVGGVIGLVNSAGTYGMLGYRRSNGTLYAVLGNGAYQNNTSRNAQSTQESIEIGIGIEGGFLGGHIRGDQYGLITKGDRFGSYTDGTTITNKAYAVINENGSGERIATYASTSTTIDVTTKGMGELVNGMARIAFDKNFAGLVSKEKPVIVTVSPMGETNGVYVASVTADGFTVKENKGGTSMVSFYWIAVGEKNNAALTEVPKEVLSKDFDKNLDNILAIDEDSKEAGKAMWWNGRTLEFGKSAPAAASPRKAQVLENAKPKK